MDIFLIAVVAYLAYFDWRTRCIPNKITFPLMLLGGAWGVYNASWQHSLLGLLATFIALLPLGVVGGLGFGDVKLFMAIAAFKGPIFTLDVLVFALLANVILGLLLSPKKFLKGLRTTFHLLVGLFVIRTLHKLEESAIRIPFAICVLLGLLVTYLLGGEGYVWQLLG